MTLSVLALAVDNLGFRHRRQHPEADQRKSVDGEEGCGILFRQGLRSRLYERWAASLFRCMTMNAVARLG